jgi:hypothetical protein
MAAMPLRSFPRRLSRRAPDIVVVTLCAALLGAWLGAPEWLASGLAILVGLLALIVLASRQRRQPRLEVVEESQDEEKPGWLAYELAGKGTPLGTYLLAFFAFLTAMLTGFDSPYGKLAWAGFMLAAAWSLANAHFPVERQPGPGPSDTIH